MTYPGLKFCPTFSPDGSQIVFAWNGDPESGSKGFDLYVKVIGSENLLRLTHHPSEYICPAWSPDGTQIAFHRLSDADTGVYVVPALGGSERKLRSTRTPIHAWVYAMISWSPDGKWIAYAEALPPAQYQDLHLLSVETLESRQIPRAAKCHNAVKPAFSRSGAQLAYSCAHTPADFEVGIYTVATFGGTSRLVTTFTGRGTAGGVAWTDGDKKLIFSHDRFGPGTGLDEITLADGSLRKLPFAQEGRWPVISSKGDKLAYVTSSYHVDIWRKDLLSPQAPAVKLISSTFDQRTPQYSPDGKHIAFESTRGGVREVWMSDADGTHLIQISNFREQLTGTPRWSPDSQKIVFDSRQSGHAELYIADIAERMPRKLATNITVVYVPSWSHDGKWIYFISGGADPQRRIYRCPANGGDAVLLAALPVGDFAYGPVESFDGSTVYFATRFRGAQLYAVSLKRVGAATMLKGMPLVSLYYLWTVAPGGIYFVPADAPKSVRYFDFETSKVREIFKVDRDFDVGLSVSSNARWILYTQVSEEKSDIMLVEHFR
jgi:Tol biopolymer transport system component